MGAIHCDVMGTDSLVLMLAASRTGAKLLMSEAGYRPEVKLYWSHKLNPFRCNWISYDKCLMACPHWFPKQDTLHPETGHFVARNGNFIYGNR